MTVHVDFSKMEVFKARAQNAAAAALTTTAIAVQGDMRRNMTKTTGRRPSAPGQPPAVQTGRLRNSVVHQPATASTLVARAGTNLAYGKFLEFGTSRGIAPRPWVGPVRLQYATGKAQKVFGIHFKKALKAGGA